MCTSGLRHFSRYVQGTPITISQAEFRRVGAKSGLRGSAIEAVANKFTEERTPALLPGTASEFPISEEELIQLAQKLFAEDAGVADESLLAEDFRFEFPVVSLDKEGFLKAVRSFGLKDAFPDLNPHPYDWRVDKYEKNRVWFTTRVTGTHTGTLKFNGKEYEATGKAVEGAPECQSFVFNDYGKCTSYTGGYIMDRRVGNTKRMGALFGILAAIGVDIPQPGK
jgi:hypothetical protein